MTGATERPGRGSGVRRFFRRGPWENAAAIIIAIGVVMLMQPYSAWAFGHSFAVILVGTLGFVVVSHFPEGGGEDG